MSRIEVMSEWGSGDKDGFRAAFQFDVQCSLYELVMRIGKSSPRVV